MISNKDELKTRLEAKQSELEARIKNLKADAQGDSRKTIEGLENRVDAIRKSLSDRWDDLSEQALDKLNDLLRDEQPTS